MSWHRLKSNATIGRTCCSRAGRERWPSSPAWRMPAVDATSIDRHPAGSTSTGAGGRPPSPSPGHRVIFIGLDGADWQLLDRYMADGTMPNLAQAGRAKGRAATVATLPSAALAAGLDDDDDRRRARSIIASSTSARQSRHAPARADHQRRARACRRSGTWQPRAARKRRRPRILGDLSGGDGQRPDRLRPAVHVPLQRVGAAAGVVYPQSLERWAARRPSPGRTGRRIRRAQARSFRGWPTRSIARLRRITDPYAHPVSALRRILIETDVYSNLGRDWFFAQYAATCCSSISKAPTASATSSRRTRRRVSPRFRESDYARYSDVPRKYFARDRSHPRAVPAAR